MQHYCVLVVDDSLVIRSLMTQIFEADPEITRIGAVATTDAATTYLQAQKVDVVVLDLEMPGTSGLQYLPTLNRMNIPVVVLSGHANEGSDTRGAALMLGASACFDKAHAVRESSGLIGIVKAAASRTFRLNEGDESLLAKVQARVRAEADELGIRREWTAVHS